MADKPQRTSIPAVPLRTPMFEEDWDAKSGAMVKHLTRTWILFFEKMAKGGGVSGVGPYTRTLLLKDTTVGNDIADHVVVYNLDGGNAFLVTGVLRKAITADLTIRINLVDPTGSTTVIGTFTIPLATTVDTALTFTKFTSQKMPYLGVLTWDVTASDGSKDAAGIASFTIEWQ